MSGFTPESLNRFKSSLKDAGGRYGKAYEVGAKAAGLYVLAESRKLVPVEHGVLAASGAVRAEGSGYETVVYVTYGTDYAVYVHENLEMSYKGKPRPSGLGNYWDASQGAGRSKFLESVLRDRRAEISRVAETAARRHLSRVRAGDRKASRAAKDPQTYLPTALI